MSNEKILIKALELIGDVPDSDATHTERASRFIRRCLHRPRTILVLHSVERF